jgi:hypothetical protein
MTVPSRHLVSRFRLKRGANDLSPADLVFRDRLLKVHALTMKMPSPHLYDRAASPDEATYPIGEIIRQCVGMRHLRHHCQHPFLQF